ALCTRRKPGSLRRGVPASETSAPSSPRRRRYQLRRALLLVVLVNADERRRDLEVVQELERTPRVLGGDPRHPAQGRQGPERDVLQVADGCGAQVERARLRPRRAAFRSV